MNNIISTPTEMFYYRNDLLMDLWVSPKWEVLPKGLLQMLNMEEIDSLLYFMRYII